MTGGVHTDELPKVRWLFAFSDDKTEWHASSLGIYGFDNPVAVGFFIFASRAKTRRAGGPYR